MMIRLDSSFLEGSDDPMVEAAREAAKESVPLDRIQFRLSGFLSQLRTESGDALAKKLMPPE